METVDRPLTTREIKILELAKVRAKKDVLAKFNTNPLIFGGLILFFILYALLNKLLPIWAIGLVSFLIVFTLLFFVFYPKSKRQAQDRQLLINQVLALNSISVKRYQCSDALVFKTWLDQAQIWALQIAPNEVMIWQDYHSEFSAILPAKEFDVIADPRIQGILGDYVSNPKQRFPPTIIPADVVGNAAIDNLPDSSEVILNTTLDELLEEAKKWS